MAKLAERYFESHCPATLSDFTWWSGLSVADAKRAIEMIKKNFISEKIESEEYWVPNSFSTPQKFKDAVFLLPAFDEFLISYKDRTAAIILENHEKAFSNNGIFWPTIVIDGQVKETWKREIKKDTLIIEFNFFENKNRMPKDILLKASEKLGDFLNSKTEINRKY